MRTETLLDKWLNALLLVLIKFADVYFWSLHVGWRRRKCRILLLLQAIHLLALEGSFRSCRCNAQPILMWSIQEWLHSPGIASPHHRQVQCWLPIRWTPSIEWNRFLSWLFRIVSHEGRHCSFCRYSNWNVKSISGLADPSWTTCYIAMMSY